MFSISSIPCVGNIWDRITDAAVDELFLRLKYMCCYKALVENLDSEIEKFDAKKARVSRETDTEKANGKEIYEDVLKWQAKAEEYRKSTVEFSEKYKSRSSWRCIHCLPIPNPFSRYRLGKEAAEKAEGVTELTVRGTDILDNVIAYLPELKNLPKPETGFEHFASRKEAYGNLLEMLASEDSSMFLGIYGMPGVGKTRMMEQLWEQAKEDGIFEIVTRANVGQEVDVIEIQRQIAVHLKCNFDSEKNVEQRASQLEYSLMGRGKILVILDDVWEDISLKEIGISFADGSSSESSCKILFTSREKEACLRNGCTNPIKIEPLSPDESWDLFSNTIKDHKPDESLAKKVCGKCAGLPLVICVVAKALMFKPRSSWLDALDQIENSNIKSIDGVSEKVYACLKLSFDHLKDDAKACLLLCAQYPEDADIPIKKLVQLATHIVSRGTLRVQAMLDTLNLSLLLLEGKDNEHIKLHDIIRQIARSISAEDRKYAFLFEKCGSWLPDVGGDATLKLLHLDVDKIDFHIPDDLDRVFSDLHTLSLKLTADWDAGIPHPAIIKFSGGVFVNLKLLMLGNFSGQRKLCLQPLGTLKTLVLDNCDMSYLPETDLFPENLETLRFWDCRFPTPYILPPLKYLKKLEMTLDYYQKALVLPRNTISSLSSLEELLIEDGFMIWEDEEILREEPVWDEISKLTRLKKLNILLKHVKPCRDTTVFSNLLEYNVTLGKRRNRYPDSKVFFVRGDLQVEGFQILMERAEIVVLDDSTIKVGLIWNSNKEVYTDLKSFHIHNGENIEYVTRIPQHEIRQVPTKSFSNLIRLEIDTCPQLKYLFCNSVAKCLKQLEELIIKRCNEMEAIVMNEGTSRGGEDFMKFLKLKILILSELPLLAGFYREKNVRDSSSALFDRMVAFPSLEEMNLHGLEETSDVWGKHYSDDQNSSSSFGKLKSLKVSDCPKLEYVIHRCNRLPNRFMGAVEQENIIEFPELTNLTLSSLPYLTSFECNHEGEANTCKVKFPKLVNFKVHGCEKIKLEAIELGGDDSTCHLKRLDINCDSEIQLPCNWQRRLRNLETLALTHCWWHQQKSLLPSPRLKVVKVHDCKCSILFSFSAFKCLQELKELELSRCAFLEKIVEDARVDETSDLDMKVITFSHLETVTLQDLPCLKSFYNSGNYDCNFRALKEVKVNNCGLSNLFSISATGSLEQLEALEISNCALMEEIVQDVKGNEPSSSGRDKKINKLLHLRTVILQDLPNLKSFMNGANYDCNLSALEEINVSNCGVSSFFSVTVLESLERLQSLIISNCAFLLEIVEDVRGEQSSGIDNKTITLLQLRLVKIFDSPNLKTLFKGANYECKLPALQELGVGGCGLSVLFTCPVFRSLKHLKRLRVYDCNMLEGIFEDVKGDENLKANDKIITISQLSLVYLSGLPRLKSFVPSVNYEFHMPALNDVHVYKCEVLSTLFMSSFFKKLQNLQDLYVSDCRLLESIVEDARDEEFFDTNDDVIYLNRLTVVTLDDLPNLENFIRTERYAFCMPCLQNVRVRRCPKVEILFFREKHTEMLIFYSDQNEYSRVQGVDNYLRYLSSKVSYLSDDSAGESGNRNEDVPSLDNESIREDDSTVSSNRIDKEDNEDEQEPNKETVECSTKESVEE